MGGVEEDPFEGGLDAQVRRQESALLSQLALRWGSEDVTALFRGRWPFLFSPLLFFVSLSLLPLFGFPPSVSLSSFPPLSLTHADTHRYICIYTYMKDCSLHRSLSAETRDECHLQDPPSLPPSTPLLLVGQTHRIALLSLSLSLVPRTMQFSTADCATLTDDSVTIVGEHKLLPSRPYDGDEVQLGPLESLVAAHIPVAVLYLYESSPPPGGAEVVPFGVFKRAVEETLTFYPQLAGRLHVDKETGARSMRSLREGALLLEARSSHVLRAYRKASPERPELPEYRLLDFPAGGNAFFAPYSPDMTSMESSVALSIQHTRFASGDVALGIRVLHTLADMAAFAQFVGDLAVAYNQLLSGAQAAALPPTGAEKPFGMDWRLDRITDPAERARILQSHPPHMFIAGDAQREQAYRALHSALHLPCPAPMPEVTVGRMLHFTAEELDAMKERYGAKVHGKATPLTAFQVLSALLYTRVYSAKVSALRSAAADGERRPPPSPSPCAMPSTTFLTSVNIRKLLAKHDETHHMREDRYFGNGVYAPLTHIPLEVAASGRVEDVAACVHSFLKEGFPSDDAAVMNMVRWVALQPDKAAIRTTFVLGGFMVSAWNHFNLYDGAILGECRPVLVTTPFTPISLVDVLVYYLPLNPKKGERGLVVYMAAGKETWAHLERFPDIAQHLFT